MAAMLVDNSLLHEAGGSFRLHDLLLDLMKIMCRDENALIAEAVGRPSQYLGNLQVLLGYCKTRKLYSLMGLWQSLFKLSDNEQLDVDAYGKSLGELGEDEPAIVAYILSALRHLFIHQVG